MGRKSSAKQHRVSPPGTAPPEPPGSSGAPRGLIIGAVILLVAVVSLLAFTRSSGSGSAPAGTPPIRTTDTTQPAGPAATPAQQPPEEVPVQATLKPHFQTSLPPLPFMPTPPARPAEVVRAAYQFAAEHPEVLTYVPCYCGCERGGHRGNEDCFVTSRDANGDVTDWEPH